MERAIIYCAKTGLEATDHFVPKLLEKYCQDNGYEIVAMLSEPASTEGVSFPMKYAIIGLNMEEDVNTIITLSKDMIGATDSKILLMMLTVVIFQLRYVHILKLRESREM